jgi:hypothetical protein
MPSIKIDIFMDQAFLSLTAFAVFSFILLFICFELIYFNIAILFSFIQKKYSYIFFSLFLTEKDVDEKGREKECGESDRTEETEETEEAEDTPLTLEKQLEQERQAEIDEMWENYWHEYLEGERKKRK